MHDLIQFISQHQLLVGMILAIGASNAVRALPEPPLNSGMFYVWFYRFAQGCLANYELARAKRRDG